MPKPDDPPPEPSGVPLTPESAEDEKLREWRIAHLEAIGLPYPLALELALVGADWHRIARAVDAGMSVEQVERVFL